MFKTISIYLVLLILVTISSVVIVSAEEDITTTNQVTTTSVDSSPPIEMTAEEKTQKIKERVAAAKEKATTRITAVQEKRIAGLCKASQAKIDNVYTSAVKLLENRQTKYESVSDKLKTLSAKLVVAGANTAELDSAITEMDTKYKTNFTVFSDFLTSLDDITTIDCSADPSGFKAVLDGAREQRKEIISQTMQLRAYINENIKPILQDLRASLNTDESQ